MKQIRIQLDDGMAARLEKVAPARSRRRSAFVRSALARALGELEERATARAYRRQPDSSAAAARERKFWDQEWRERPRTARGR